MATKHPNQNSQEISICKEANLLFVCLADIQESSSNITRQPGFGLLQNVE
jgi:hypothetical protein